MSLCFPFETPPDPGAAVEVAEGILWLQLPLPMALDHVNVYALADSDGWTLIDTGMNSRKSREIWTAALAGPLAGKPVARVLLTHHHPDHVGLVGWFQDRGAALLTTRNAWLYARMLTLDVQDRPSAQSMHFYTRAGMPAEILAKRATERPFNFADVVAPMPLGFTRVDEGQTLTLAGRRWRVRLGQGHAPDHITLWSEEDALVIGGDQLLSGISPNIGVYPTEPEADPLTEWLKATARASAQSPDGGRLFSCALQTPDRRGGIRAGAGRGGGASELPLASRAGLPFAGAGWGLAVAGDVTLDGNHPLRVGQKRRRG